jgi:hypothetical protein
VAAPLPAWTEAKLKMRLQKESGTPGGACPLLSSLESKRLSQPLYREQRMNQCVG